jgi:hypothetical protein
LSAKKALLAALASLLALATLALFIPMDSPGLGHEVEKQVRSATGIPLEISRARLRLLRGLILEESSASGNFVVGSYQAHLPRMAFEHRPLALLRGRLELSGIRLERPAVLLDFGRRSGDPVIVRYAAFLETLEPGEPWLELDTSLETIRIEEGELVVRGSAALQGLDLTLRNVAYDRRAVTPLHALRSQGDVAVRELVLSSSRLRDVAANLATEGGRLRLEGLRLGSDRGELSGDLVLDFNSFPFRYRASLLGRSFEVEGAGRGTLRLEAEGFGTQARNLKGKGSFRLEGGRFPDAPWIREIDPSLAGAEHVPVEIPFEVRDERVYFERVELETTVKTVAIEGSVGLDGSTDLRGTVNRRRD